MQVERSKDNLKLCSCMHCPSYTMGCKIKAMPLNIVHMVEGINKQEHFEGMYCAFDKSSCISENNGCECINCNLAKKYDLHKRSYCLSDGGI